ncbi:unnamed protein product [Pleuronectes platessa]|uniref:Uncharacterized protein n=1 Tax=Pleuronectes platessa TaxID=8262 RepID=A0A9N7ZA26_PLEPL|nr:unnamed protein product [Pleuronectes platessa]
MRSCLNRRVFAAQQAAQIRAHQNSSNHQTSAVGGFLALLMAAPQSGHVTNHTSWEQPGVFAVGDAAAAPVAKEKAAGCLNNNGRLVNIPTVGTDSSSTTASTYTPLEKHTQTHACCSRYTRRRYTVPLRFLGLEPGQSNTLSCTPPPSIPPSPRSTASLHPAALHHPSSFASAPSLHPPKTLHAHSPWGRERLGDRERERVWGLALAAGARCGVNAGSAPLLARVTEPLPRRPQPSARGMSPLHLGWSPRRETVLLPRQRLLAAAAAAVSCDRSSALAQTDICARKDGERRGGKSRGKGEKCKKRGAGTVLQSLPLGSGGDTAALERCPPVLSDRDSPVCGRHK